MNPSRARLEQLALALMGLAVIGVLLAAAPRVMAALHGPAPLPTPSVPPPPPQGLLLPDELGRDEQSVFIVVVQTQPADPLRVGTAFAADTHDTLLSSADLVRGASAIRLIDTSGGNHAVGVIAVDETLGVAALRVPLSATPLPTGDPASLQVADPLALVAPEKNAAIASSSPATVAGIGASAQGPQGAIENLLRLSVAVPPAATGAPVVAAGGKVMGVTISAPDGRASAWFAVPISEVGARLPGWASAPARVLPLAPVPDTLVLRGLDETSAGAGGTPAPGGASGGLALQSVQPTRASSSQGGPLTILGTGFVGGPALKVHFTPTASASGAFDGSKPSVPEASTITVSVPPGMRVQDYVIQVVNGDGTVAPTQLPFTVIP